MEIAVTLFSDPQHMGDAVKLSDGSSFPEWLEAWAYVGDLLAIINLRVQGGEPVLHSVSLSRSDDDPKPLTGTRVQEVPVDEVVRRTIGVVKQFMAQPAAEDRRGRRSLDDKDLLREVAEVVSRDREGQPNKAVVKRFGVSPRTATRWIKAAEPYMEQKEKGAKR